MLHTACKKGPPTCPRSLKYLRLIKSLQKCEIVKCVSPACPVFLPRRCLFQCLVPILPHTLRSEPHHFHMVVFCCQMGFSVACSDPSSFSTFLCLVIALCPLYDEFNHHHLLGGIGKHDHVWTEILWHVPNLFDVQARHSKQIVWVKHPEHCKIRIKIKVNKNNLWRPHRIAGKTVRD